MQNAITNVTSPAYHSNYSREESDQALAICRKEGISLSKIESWRSKGLSLDRIEQCLPLRQTTVFVNVLDTSVLIDSIDAASEEFVEEVVETLSEAIEQTSYALGRGKTWLRDFVLDIASAIPGGAVEIYQRILRSDDALEELIEEYADQIVMARRLAGVRPGRNLLSQCI